jgi:hypothetical protein
MYEIGIILITFGIAAASFYVGLKMGAKGYTPPSLPALPTRGHARRAPEPHYSLRKEKEKEEEEPA